MAYDLLGKNFVPPDVHGKVTGKAKYAEDFRAEGMCRFGRIKKNGASPPRFRRRRVEDQKAISSVNWIRRPNSS